MSHVELRPAETPTERAHVAALARLIWHEHYPGIISRAQIEHMLATGYSIDTLTTQQAAGTRLTLAWQDDEAVGFAAVSPDPAAPTVAWLDKLYVRADARNTGIGRALVERAFAQACLLRADTLRLRVNRVNRDNIGAIAAYHRLGFAIETSDIKSIGQGYVMDDYIMAAALTGRPSALHGSS